MAYLAISLWVVPDIAVRAAGLADVPVADLVGTQRHYWGAVVTLVAAVLDACRRGAAHAGTGEGPVG